MKTDDPQLRIAKLYWRRIKCRQRILTAVIFVGLAGLAGCGTIDPQGAKVTKFGPNSVIQQPVDEPDLVSLITKGGASFSVSNTAKPEEFSTALDKAFLTFYSSPGTDEDKRLHRNRVQDRLILASSAACGAFKTVLKRKQADRNFEFGTATVLFGAAGAVATSAQAAKSLAALAGVSGGVRAEYNRDFFSDVAAHVITKGINSRRKEMLGGIVAGQGKPITEYSLEAALSDAVVFHGACSLVGGLEYAEGAIAKVDGQQVGLDALKAVTKALEPAK